MHLLENELIMKIIHYLIDRTDYMFCFLGLSTKHFWTQFVFYFAVFE